MPDAARLAINPDTLAPPTGAPATPFYTWVVKRGNMVLLSGMSPYTKDKRLAEPDDQAGHTRQAFLNMKAALEGVGATMADVCQITIYVHETHLQRDVYPKINPVCHEFFPKDPPARAVIGGVALPRNTERVLITGTAVLP